MEVEQRPVLRVLQKLGWAGRAAREAMRAAQEAMRIAISVQGKHPKPA